LGAALCSAAISAPPTRREAQLEDLEFARSAYVEKSGAFSPADRQAALALIERLKQRTGSLSDEEFMVGIIEIPALARNGHDSFNIGDGAWLPAQRAPLRFIWFPDALVVARAAPSQADLLGARVERIEGLTPPQLFARLGVVCGGTEQYRHWNVGWIIERGLLHGLGIARTSDALRLEVKLPNGKRVRRTVAFLPTSSVPPGAEMYRFWSAEPYAEEVKHAWRAAIDAKDSPLYLQEPEELYRMARPEGIDALYVQFRTNDDPEHKVVQFVQDVEKRIESERPQNLILDLRFDTGGNIDLTRDLMRFIPAHVPGRIYTLIGPYTFSAGIVAAAAIKHDGDERVALIGDTVGDSLRWWSEAHDQCLPNSHYCLRPSTGLWDLVKGCKDETGCYGDAYEANVGSLDPKIRAPLTSVEWFAGRDPALVAVRADLK
jgi:hypothetical protein